MYLIRYVDYGYDYDMNEQYEYINLGLVHTEEEAKEICNTYNINFKYVKCDVYDTPDQFFGDNIKWSNTIHLTIELNTKTIDVDLYSNPDYKTEVYRKAHYQIDTSGRNLISISIAFNSDEEIRDFNKNTINFVLKHLCESSQKINKQIIAKEILKLFISEVNKQYDQELELQKEIRDFGYLN